MRSFGQCAQLTANRTQDIEIIIDKPQTAPKPVAYVAPIATASFIKLTCPLANTRKSRKP